MLFDGDFLKKLEYLSLLSRKVFRGQVLAQRRTTRLGSGVEFADHRGYVPGDDYRYLDWNLYARHEELLLRRFQEEEDLHLYLLLDCSRSMAAGDPPKFDLARRLAAALAYVALADLDRVAVVAFADGVLKDFPLTRGKGRILSLMRFLEDLPASGTGTNLSSLVSAFVGRPQRRGLAVVLSDLFDPTGYVTPLGRLLHHGYEPHVVHLYDKKEAEPTFLGDVELEDVETGERRKRTVTEKNLRDYRRVFGEFVGGVRLWCRSHAAGCTTTTTEVPFDELLMRMMRTASVVGA